VLLEIDVNGGRQVSERNPEALLIFVDAPSIDAQRARLIGRGERPERADARIAEGIKERRESKRLGYHFVINDALDDAVDEVRALIAQYRRCQESPAQT
jgi:guanylate kinase